MKPNDAPHWIGTLSLGAGLATICGFFTLLASFGLTMKINPALRGAAYWAVVRDRIADAPILAGACLLFALGTLFGVAVMGVALRRGWRDR